MRNIGDDLKHLGWARLNFRFSASELAKLSQLNPHIGRGRRLTDMKAVSNVLPIGFQEGLAELGFRTMPNRAVGFIKSKKSNWSLPWHQDRIIAMTEKIEDPRYINWNRKSGIWHCEPPEETLRKMAFTYIAFDAFKGTGGSIELAVGTHLRGKIPKEDISSLIKGSNIVTPDMSVGEVLIISALMLHRSALYLKEGPRRGLRMDFMPAS